MLLEQSLLHTPKVVQLNNNKTQIAVSIWQMGVNMKIEYNDKLDLLYLRFDETRQEVVNQRINDDIVLDIGTDDKIVGIEILGAKNVLNLNNVLPISFYNSRKEEAVDN